MAIVTLPRQGEAGTTLTETVSAAASWIKTYNWTISKTASPGVLNLFRNDTGTIQYTVSVTNDAGVSEAFIVGQVCITNGGAVATEHLENTLVLTYPPSTAEIVSQQLDISANPILQPGQSFCYPYRINIPLASFIPGISCKVTANTTITNHSGHPGTPFGPSESASGTLPSTQTIANQTINVDDDNGISFSFTANTSPLSQSYTRNYSCNTDQGKHTNTATIRETGQTASATIIINRYDLLVSKTARTSFTRTYKWILSKKAVDTNGATINNLVLAVNESYLVKYIIDVTPTFTDSNFMVTGEITVVNPNPERTATIMVSDLIQPGGINASVVPASASVPPSSSLTFTYTAMLPDNASRINQVTATLSNIPSNSTNFVSPDTPVDFSTAVINEIDPCVTVTDSIGGQLMPSPVCRIPTEFQFTSTVGPYSSCSNASIQIDNTATFTTNTTQTAGSANWAILVTVPCSGCTLTIGFWKTHAGIGPGHQPDLVTALLPIHLGDSGGSDTVYVTTAAQAVSILSLGGSNGVIDAANGINMLYAQLLAAKLNINNGAEGSAVSSTILSADNFLSTHNSNSWGDLNRQQRAFVNNLRSILESYNSGLIGPGHCSEQMDTNLILSQTTAVIAESAVSPASAAYPEDDTGISFRKDSEQPATHKDCGCKASQAQNSHKDNGCKKQSFGWHHNNGWHK